MRPPTKLISKYHRLRMSDDIRGLLKQLPVRRMQESQVGNHVYQGAGEIKVGTSYIPVSLRIRIVRGRPTVFLNADRAGIAVTCPFEGADKAVKEAIRKSLS